MLKAIHKKTGNVVSAFKVENDSSWIGTEKDEWIALRPSIDNWKFLKEKDINEVKVSFVKSHRRDKEIEGDKLIFVCSHFKNECEYAILNQESESEEHKLAKEAIYEQILNNNISIDGKKIREWEIEDLDFEYRLSKSKRSKIADVILIFKKEDERLGKGIVFEIQFSNQNQEVTEERTYDRVIEGYSVVWLWEGDFEDNKLRNREVLVVPFSRAIKEYQEIIKSEWEEKSRYLGALFENKVKKSVIDFDDKFKETLKSIKSYSDMIVKGWDNLNEEKTAHLYSQESLLKKEMNEYFVKHLNEIDNSIKGKLQDEEIIKKVVSFIDYNKISSAIDQDYHKWLEQNLSKVLLEETEKARNRIYPLIMEKIQTEVIPKIESSLKTNIKTETVCECHSCKLIVSIKNMEYQDGWAYCTDCFNKLKVNWKKEYPSDLLKPIPMGTKEIKDENKVYQRQHNL